MTETTNLNGPWRTVPHPLDVPMGTEPENGISVTFTGKRGALFWLALKTGFFTILTLGFYRFWMKTRLRRWYWSAMRPGGHPLEYVGDPLEKLLGFFIAVVILTFYIGIVNLLLMFVSFSVFNSSVLGYVLSFAGVIPIWFYARYRARRYVLARTRWRGVRFGLEKGAWGYALRALWYWFVTIVTLGILWPRMTFLLEKYKTDRTFYGSARLLQGGNWQMLYRATIPLVLSLLLLAGAALWTFWWDPVLADLSDSSLIFPAIEDLFEGGSLATAWHDPERLLLFPLALSGMVFGAIYYRWVSKRIMANHKIGPGIQFASALSGARVTFIYVLGNFIAYTMLVLGVLALVLLAILMFAGPDSLASNNYLGMDVLQDMPSWLSFVLLAILYLTFFLMWGVLYNTFVTFPLMRHMARTTSLPLIAGLPLISQRTRDEFAEAEGFAEALDLGAAI